MRNFKSKIVFPLIILILAPLRAQESGVNERYNYIFMRMKKTTDRRKKWDLKNPRFTIIVTTKVNDCMAKHRDIKEEKKLGEYFVKKKHGVYHAYIYRATDSKSTIRDCGFNYFKHAGIDEIIWFKKGRNRLILFQKGKSDEILHIVLKLPLKTTKKSVKE